MCLFPVNNSTNAEIQNPLEPRTTNTTVTPRPPNFARQRSGSRVNFSNNNDNNNSNQQTPLRRNNSNTSMPIQRSSSTLSESGLATSTSSKSGSYNHRHDLNVFILLLMLVSMSMFILNGVLDESEPVADSGFLIDLPPSPALTRSMGVHAASNHYLAKMWTFFSERILEDELTTLKKQLLSNDNIQGDVLEIGCGNGVNFDYLKHHRYPNVFKWTCIEPNTYFYDKLEENARKAFFVPGRNFTILESPLTAASSSMSQQSPLLTSHSRHYSLDDEEEKFDVILSTFTLCELGNRDIIPVLHKLYKLLKPDGSLIFIENNPLLHAPSSAASMLANVISHAYSPLWRTFTGSCPLTTNVVGAVQSLPWKKAEVHRYAKQSLLAKYLKLDLTPIYYGVATKTTRFDDFLAGLKVF